MRDNVEHILIAGGTGHLGASLVSKFRGDGYQVTLLSRQKQHDPSTVYWDGETIGEWADVLNNTDIVINLCGKPVACRYTEANKRELIRSRVATTQLIGDAIAKSSTPPRLWINASSSAYYGFSSDVKDDSDEPGSDFPAEICVAWERAFYNALTPHTRKVAWRLGVVVQGRKGLIVPFIDLVKGLLGGSLGSGSQYFTWIDEVDFQNAALWTVKQRHVSGSYNLTSPEPVTNEAFMSALREALGVRTGISLPAWMLAIGGKIIGVEPYLILDGRRVIPSKLLEQGFVFRYAQIHRSLNRSFNKEPT